VKMMTDPKQLEAAAGAAGAELGEAEVADPDQLLMMRARDGDLDAFHQLFKKYQTPIFNYCIRMIDNYDRAQELTQDAFLQLYRARERYEPTARFITYLFRIATNLCLNERRRRVRWARTMSNEMPDANLMPDPRGVPADDVVIHAESLDRVQKAIARLPSRKAAALLLARVDGLSHAEVSETLGISVNAVKSLISRATRALRAELGLAGADDPLPQAVAARESGRHVAALHA
jgi:RNA polymerase sigma-70 factor, ECF subfamily